NAIIKQQGDSPLVAGNTWSSAGAGSFILGAVAGGVLTAGRWARRDGRGGDSEAADSSRLADQLRAPRWGEGRAREHDRRISGGICHGRRGRGMRRTCLR